MPKDLSKSVRKHSSRIKYQSNGSFVVSVTDRCFIYPVVGTVREVKWWFIWLLGTFFKNVQSPEESRKCRVKRSLSEQRLLVRKGY